MNAVPLILFYFTIPLLILYLIARYSFARKIGGVLIAYIIGLLIGSGDIITESGKEIQELVSTVSIALALPLLLFSMNIRTWFRQIRTTMLSLLLGVLSVIIVIVLGFILFRNHIPELWKIAGMLTGVYTGGTPNLASIKIALDVDTETYILAHTYDMLVSAVFLLFVMSVCKQLLLLFLPAYSFSQSKSFVSDDVPIQREKSDLFKKSIIRKLIVALILSLLIVAIAGGLSVLFPESMSMAVAILGITTLAIIASLFKQINQIRYTFDFGMYFILVFSLVVASMADFRNFSIEHGHLLLYIVIGVFGSFAIHVLLAKIFRIDVDNVIIVSTALACSPPFVPVVAGAIRNKEIIMSGITVGIIGYAIGNYLGISIAYVLQYLFY